MISAGRSNSTSPKSSNLRWLKILVFPLVFLGLLMLVRPDYSIALIIILQSAVPPITAIPLLAERSGGNRVISGQFIVASFIFSIISIPSYVVPVQHSYPGSIGLS